MSCLCCFTLAVFLADLLDRFSLQILCLNDKTLFSLANANNSASFKRKMVLKSQFLLISQRTNKLVNEAANDSAQVSGQDCKQPPALGTNQIAGLKNSAYSLTKKNLNKDIFWNHM